MKHPVELAAQFIRRADYVLANDVLRDEYGVEYGNPAQIGFYEFHYTCRSISEALKNIAEMFSCLTHMVCEGGSTWLTVVGEKFSIDNLQEVQRLAAYTYKESLNKRASEADIRSVEEYEKWSGDYILGFFEGVAGNPQKVTISNFSNHPRVQGIIDGFEQCIKENK